jgi:hypothetical protein
MRVSDVCQCEHGLKSSWAYLVYRQMLGSDQLLGASHDRLLGPLARTAQPLLLQHGDDLGADGRGVAVLVVRGATRITEYYAVVGRVDVAVACLALGREQRLGRLPPLDALRGLRYGGHECDGFVHVSAGLGASGQRRVRVRDVRVVVVLRFVRPYLPC